MSDTPPGWVPPGGPSTPFTIALSPLPEQDWLRPGPDALAQLAEKRRVLSLHERSVIAEDDGPGGRELLALVRDWLRAHGGPDYQVNEQNVQLPDGTDVLADPARPFHSLARLVQDDFCLLRKTPSGHVLTAACLCFPSSWRLAEKLGKPLEAVHDPVPGYQEKMAHRVNRIFDNLRPDQIVWRQNWSVDEGYDLYRPVPHDHSQWMAAGEDPLVRLSIRTERQTLRKLPKSSDIVFTIRIGQMPLQSLNDPGKEQLRSLFANQLASLTEEECAYKGLTSARPLILKKLERPG